MGTVYESNDVRHIIKRLRTSMMQSEFAGERFDAQLWRRLLELPQMGFKKNFDSRNEYRAGGGFLGILGTGIWGWGWGYPLIFESGDMGTGMNSWIPQI